MTTARWTRSRARGRQVVLQPRRTTGNGTRTMRVVSSFIVFVTPPLGDIPLTPAFRITHLAGTYDTAASSSMSTYRETPVINFHLRPTLHRVLHDGPVPVIMANGDASSSQTATTLSRIRGIRARIRHRQRGLGQGAEEGEARLDEESDEEREVGLGEASGAPLLPDGQRPNR